MYKPETATRTDNLLERMSWDSAGGRGEKKSEHLNNSAWFLEDLESFPIKKAEILNMLQEWNSIQVNSQHFDKNPDFDMQNSIDWHSQY